MSLILCLETATTNCSVALAEDGKPIALIEENTKNYSHAEQLHLFIQKVLKKAHVSLEQLDAIAVSKGPGSYTGLRIGVSAAKGLCFALDIPLLSVSTLQVLALQGATKEGLLVPMLDARRMEVYTAVYTPQLEEVWPVQAKVLEPSTFQELLEKQQLYFLGNANPKFQDICTHHNAIFLEETLPSASELCILAAAKYKIGDTENVAYFEPFYLKDFIAG